jgi:hypothetical protein
MSPEIGKNMSRKFRVQGIIFGNVSMAGRFQTEATMKRVQIIAECGQPHKMATAFGAPGLGILLANSGFAAQAHRAGNP